MSAPTKTPRTDAAEESLQSWNDTRSRPGRMLVDSFLCRTIETEREALHAALQAQQLYEDLEHEFDHEFPPPDLERYVPIIGPWDGVTDKFARYVTFQSKVEEMRRAALTGEAGES